MFSGGRAYLRAVQVLASYWSGSTGISPTNMHRLKTGKILEVVLKIVVVLCTMKFNYLKIKYAFLGLQYVCVFEKAIHFS